MFGYRKFKRRDKGKVEENKIKKINLKLINYLIYFLKFIFIIWKFNNFKILKFLIKFNYIWFFSNFFL